ncbi:MAG: HEAT repeat domain-containing protein, partial [Blastocatellia bacterium]
LMTGKSTATKFVQSACLSLLALIFGGSLALAQEVADSRQAKEERLVAMLASGNEEQKLEAAIELGSLLSATTQATQQTVSSLGNVLGRDSSAVIRSLAARAMELSRDDRFVSVLLSSLNSEREVAVRKTIIYALARHNSTQVVAALLPGLKDRQQDIRAAAAYALAEIGDPASADSLIELLGKRGKDEDAFARSQAARGLGKMGNRAAIDDLLKALNRDKSSEVRRESVRSLGQIANVQDVKIVEALKLAKLESDPYLAALAASALERLSP